MVRDILYFQVKDKTKRFPRSSYPPPQTRPLYTRRCVVEIFTMIGSRIPPLSNSPRDIFCSFSDRANVPLPHRCMFSQPIAFGLVVPDVTTKITCARAHLKPMTRSEQQTLNTQKIVLVEKRTIAKKNSEEMVDVDGGEILIPKKPRRKI